MRVGALKLKAQVWRGNEPAIGPGKADLLEAIDRHGSISAAGRALGMSYRRAWLLVDAMNRHFIRRVVDTGPGGTRLTETGSAALAAYRALEGRLAQLADDPACDRLTTLLRKDQI